MSARPLGGPVARAPGPGAELPLAAALSLACALIHAQAAVDHFAGSVLYAVLFAAVAAAQGLWAVAVMRRPRPGLLRAGLIGMPAVALAWALSRTVGLPFGPDAAGPEAAGLLDVLATADEIAVAVLLATVLLGRGRRPAGAVRAASLLLVLLSSLAFAGGTHAH